LVLALCVVGTVYCHQLGVLRFHLFHPREHHYAYGHLNSSSLEFRPSHQFDLPEHFELPAMTAFDGVAHQYTYNFRSRDRRQNFTTVDSHTGQLKFACNGLANWPFFLAIEYDTQSHQLYGLYLNHTHTAHAHVASIDYQKCAYTNLLTIGWHEYFWFLDDTGFAIDSATRRLFIPYSNNATIQHHLLTVDLAAAKVVSNVTLHGIVFGMMDLFWRPRTKHLFGLHRFITGLDVGQIDPTSGNVTNMHLFRDHHFLTPANLAGYDHTRDLLYLEALVHPRPPTFNLLTVQLETKEVTQSRRYEDFYDGFAPLFD